MARYQDISEIVRKEGEALARAYGVIHFFSEIKLDRESIPAFRDLLTETQRLVGNPRYKSISPADKVQYASYHAQVITSGIESALREIEYALEGANLDASLMDEFTACAREAAEDLEKPGFHERSRARCNKYIVQNLSLMRIKSLFLPENKQRH